MVDSSPKFIVGGGYGLGDDGSGIIVKLLTTVPGDALNVAVMFPDVMVVVPFGPIGTGEEGAFSDIVPAFHPAQKLPL